MTHDELCPLNQGSKHPMWRAAAPMRDLICECDLIRKVRDDERRTLTGGERHREWWIAFGMGKVEGRADALTEARAAVAELGCNDQCGCSVTIPNPLAAIDALRPADLPLPDPQTSPKETPDDH